MVCIATSRHRIRVVHVGISVDNPYKQIEALGYRGRKQVFFLPPLLMQAHWLLDFYVPTSHHEHLVMGLHPLAYLGFTCMFYHTSHLLYSCIVGIHILADHFTVLAPVMIALRWKPASTISGAGRQCVESLTTLGDISPQVTQPRKTTERQLEGQGSNEVMHRSAKPDTGILILFRLYYRIHSDFLVPFLLRVRNQTDYI